MQDDRWRPNYQAGDAESPVSTPATIIDDKRLAPTPCGHNNRRLAMVLHGTPTRLVDWSLRDKAGLSRSPSQDVHTVQRCMHTPPFQGDREPCYTSGREATAASEGPRDPSPERNADADPAVPKTAEAPIHWRGVNEIGKLFRQRSNPRESEPVPSSPIPTGGLKGRRSPHRAHPPQNRRRPANSR